MPYYDNQRDSNSDRAIIYEMFILSCMPHANHPLRHELEVAVSFGGWIKLTTLSNIACWEQAWPGGWGNSRKRISCQEIDLSRVRIRNGAIPHRMALKGPPCNYIDHVFTNLPLQPFRLRSTSLPLVSSRAARIIAWIPISSCDQER